MGQKGRAVMWPSEIPPFVPFFIAAALALFTRGTVRSVVMLVIILVSGLHLWLLPPGISVEYRFLEYTIVPYRVDQLSLIFGYVFHLAALMSVLFSLHIRDSTQHVSGLLYAGSALGAVFSGDL